MAQTPKQDLSRMELVYGKKALEQLAKTHVLISGLNGLGVEVAKNVVLANTKAVSIHDTKDCTHMDLSSQFYLEEGDIGKNRAACTLKKLQELNPACSIAVASGGLLEAAQATKATVVVAIDVPEAEAIEVNEWCRTRMPPVKFIRTDVRGLFGAVFVDFGPGFTCIDTNGENPKTAVVREIVKGNPGVVKCIFDEDGRHDLESGEKVTFSQVKGMEGLNDISTPRTVKVINPYDFEIGDISDLGDYTGGGIVTQVKEPKVIEFDSLKDNLEKPGDFQYEPDFAKWGRSVFMHHAFRALDVFYTKNGNLPTAADADALTAIVKELVDAADDMHKVDMEDAFVLFSIKALAAGAAAVLNPMACIFGGIVGQEVVKAVSGKYHPIVPWFFLDAVECLPKDTIPTDTAPNGDRYDSQNLVFGKEFMDKMKSLKYFLVGAGALGCEFIKNMAMMGVACDGGKVTVTDDDTIELSNLSRQFLFRVNHVGDPKSTTAANSVKAMNPDFNIEALQFRVAPNTETVFNTEFWEGLSGVCNALDNVKARKYVDERCVFFGKSLLESGTLGTKANVQVVLPHKTENYGASSDPPEKTAPMCTLHNFPHNIDHTLVWARSEFTGLVEKYPSDAVKYLEEGDAFVTNMKDAGASDGDISSTIRGNPLWGGGILSIFEEQSSTFEDCIVWARHKFEHYTANMIKQLTFNFPEDAMDNSKATPVPFWSPPKRFPTALVFDPEDEMCMQFIISAANLRAKTYGIAPPEDNRDPEMFKKVLAGVTVPEFTPKKGVKIETDTEKKTASTAGSEDLAAVVAKLPKTADVKVKIVPDEFEKDDPTNFHIDFVCALSNLRARNYGIDEVDTLTARSKAGRIIPAIATTTAMITGFVCLELYKTLNRDDIEAFRNAYVNLALPVWALSEPVPPQKSVSRSVKECPDPTNHPDYFEERDVVAYPEGHSVWDKLECDLPATATLKEFCDFWTTKHSLSVDDVSYQHLIYQSAIPAHKERLEENFIDLLERITGKTVRGDAVILPNVTFDPPEDADELDTPLIVWKVKY